MKQSQLSCQNELTCFCYCTVSAYAIEQYLLKYIHLSYITTLVWFFPWSRVTILSFHSALYRKVVWIVTVTGLCLFLFISTSLCLIVYVADIKWWSCWDSKTAGCSGRITGIIIWNFASLCIVPRTLFWHIIVFWDIVPDLQAFIFLVLAGHEARQAC
jgi:hypothetical protein